MTAELERRFGPFLESERIAADASTREFRRVRLPGRTAILMRDPGATAEAFDRLLAAHVMLTSCGAPLPRILDSEVTLSSVLFEDLGDRLLADALPGMTQDDAGAAYESAARIAGRIALEGTPRVGASHVLAKRPLGRERLRIELAFFATHDVAGRRGIGDIALMTRLSSVLDRVAAEAAASPPELAHRDFHARNILLLDGGGLGVVDFQDALLAPMHYDLASLLLDPYVEPGDGVIARAAAAYADERGRAIDPLDDPRFAWTGLQRLLKAIGTYAFQVAARGGAHFGASIPVAERRALALAERVADSFSAEICSVLEELGFER